jgi:hypothetical protein
MRIATVIVVSATLAVGCSGDRSPSVTAPPAAANPALTKAVVTADGVVTETYADGTSRTRLAVTAPARATADDPINHVPVMQLKTTPAADETTTPYPTITGSAPLTVRFNLCQSSDADQNLTNPEQGDTLNWQFSFGDAAPAFNQDGSFHPDYERFCRVEHTYDTGRYTATVSVTDKHLRDESSDVTALARVTQSLTIVALGHVAPALPGCAFTTLPPSQWLATLDGQNLTCTCPSNGQVLSFIPAFQAGCVAAGLNGGAIWFNGVGCGCFP